MLLHLAVCARMNALLVKTNHLPLVVQAIYLSKEYEAEHYLAYAETKVGCVRAPPHLCLVERLGGDRNGSYRPR
jgi:hypothetical protein